VAPTTAPASPTAVSGNSAAVTIQGFAFNPQVITVKVGTTITWTDMDSTAHTVTSLSGPTSFNSGNLTPSGGTFHFMFSQAGTYSYHCMIHPSMTATVVVVS
jgi:plastocyanin